MIAVTFALPAESSDFVRLLERVHSPGADAISGTLHGRPVEILHTGVGERVARERLAPFLQRCAPHVLISAGYAGALNNDLCIAELLLVENFSQPELLALARSALVAGTFRVGKLVSTQAIVDSTKDRIELARTTDAIAVDMETEFIAEACAKRQIPMLSLRAISDTPAAPFPVPVRVLFDMEQQRINFFSLAAHLAAHPQAVPRVATFARRVRSARRALTSALDRLLQEATLLRIA